MRRLPQSSSATPVHRISGPVELLEAVPYLLGFHPRRSLVVVGLRSRRLVVTARLDLVDAVRPEVMNHTLAALGDGGATAVVCIAYEDDAEPDQVIPEAGFTWLEYVEVLRAAARRSRCEFGDAMLVSEASSEPSDAPSEDSDASSETRWWSLTCDVPECCPPEGRVVNSSATSAFAALATYEGLVARPDRASLEALLDPLPPEQRHRLDAAIAAEQTEAVQAVLRGDGDQRSRRIKRELFAAARASDAPAAATIPDAEAARYGVALAAQESRDAVWIAIDAGRIDGRPLWLDLARRLPVPYDAGPAFLFGWASWRKGNGALAGIAAERAIDSDPGYVAADLLMAAVTSGVSPHTVPRMRKPA